MKNTQKNIILGVTASIAIYKACDLVRQLKECGWAVDVVMTQEATELIRPIVFQSLSGRKVYSGGLFDAPDAWEIEHVSLAARADLILIAPATANVIAKLVGGICDDLLSCAVIASRAPVLIAPAMNVKMWNNAATQTNVKILKSRGVCIVETGTGDLACGYQGKGRMASHEKILSVVKACLRK